ncbi:MAG: AtpZ/AtpI family protein [Planctomycetota bacterium]
MIAQAAAWGSRITAIALEMVVPGIIGLWIDRQLGTVMVFLVLGVAMGMTVGMIQLVRLAASAQRDEQALSDREPPHDDSQ